ncbi:MULTISPECIES: glycosyltransferase family 9 protein [Pseudoalteromonas]|uniref:glycosyltransferase family 9 protein n=1 Tax=Pseudoalteromonas TaxID=53246 RepID=UPI000F7B769A|nr:MULTISPECIES: glycosyltransferase family 9 protein [Pseudoalteromonas]MCG7562013.1 glycosyltransferase family 9 protein [Pseudoalteromonas sp. McH1-42]MEC4088382.1 glycosyltransferase family 9 protein [Pseudoalteromonas rubra]
MSKKAIEPNNINGPILVILPRFIGDAINSLPAIELLNNLYPGKKVCLLIRPYMRDVLERAEGYDFELIEDARYHPNERIGLYRFAKTLKASQFSMAVLLRGSFIEAVLAKLAGIRYVVGYAQNGRKPLLSHPLKLNECHHYIFRYCRLVNDAHGKPLQSFSLPRLKANKAQLTHPEPHATAVYIGGKNKATRHYPVHLAANALTKIVAQTQTHLYLLGDSSEYHDAEELRQQLARKNIEATNLAGTTSLGELVDTISAMDAMITIDSGPMHIASACNIPTLALVGLGTSPFSLVAPLTTHCQVITSHSTSLNEAEIICAIEPEYLAERYLDLFK